MDQHPGERKNQINLIGAYINHLRIRNRSNLTFDHYESLLNRFNQYLLEQQAGDLTTGDVSGLTRQSLEGFYQSLMDRTVVSTRNNYASILNSFCAFLFENNYMDTDVSKALIPVRDRYSDRPPEDERVNYYPAEVLKALYEYLSANVTNISCRNLALAALMLSSGLRISEACSLNVSSVQDMEKGTAKCLRKGGIWGSFVVAEYALTHLRTYLGLRVVKESDPLFVSSHGNRLTRIAAWKALARVQRELGIETGTHILRHTAVTNVANETGSTTDAFHFAGHRAPQTTAKYMHPNFSKLNRDASSSTISSIFGGK